MEFPDLGKHCSESTCKRLDFLPMKCDACSRIFCNDHIQYVTHKCTESYKKDNQVPVCPLCNKPIPLRKGEVADMVVGQHIDTDCQSDPAKERRKVYTNRCNFKSCKQKELVPVKCDKCNLNFCLRHRHESDHSCKGFQGTGRGMSSAGAAAVQRQLPSKAGVSKKPQQTSLSGYGAQLNRERQARAAQRSMQGQGPGSNARGQPVGSYQAGLSESEAMTRALQLSLAESQPNTGGPPENSQNNEDEDLALARAIAASEQEAAWQQHQQQQHQQQQQRQASQQKESSCALS